MEIIKQKKEIILLLSCFSIFIFIRSIHFPLHLNFSTDQALSSIESLKIFNDKSIRLIGPPSSINFEGRNIFFGSVIYYFQLIFLVLGGFDPVISSYLFMVFCAMMIFPLYFGVKMLLNSKSAWVMVILYSLLPFYINYTRFLWNPNFQLSLSPVLILLMGFFHTKKKAGILLVLSIYLGALLQFHYQFIIILIGLTVYYFLYKRLNYTFFIYYFSGLIIGFLPIIIFELRNSYYNSRTLILYLQNMRVLLPDLKNQGDNSHYFLSISLFLSILLIRYTHKRVGYSAVYALFILLFLYSLIMYTPAPSQGFRMVKNWNYPAEEKVSQIIRSQNLSNINIANLPYDTLSAVQKYLLFKNGGANNLDDYRNNKYLYIINKDENFMENPAYEVNTFKPSIILKKWPINSAYNLYLLKRADQTSN